MVGRIIDVIEMLKHDFQARYRVEPNVCAISRDTYDELCDNLESIKEYINMPDMDHICGMLISIDLETENSVRVGYFSESCRVDCEVE